MTTPGATPFRLPPERKVCTDCGQWYYSWGAHAEQCPGPRQRIMPPSAPTPGSECGCNTGGWHERDCPHVTGDWDEAA